MQPARHWLARLARVGYAAKALLYASIGLLAAGAALGLGGTATDTRGAMGAVVEMPFGRVLLGVMAVGLAGYAIWRIVEAVADPEQRGRDLKGVARRASSFARGLVHGGLAFSAARLAVTLQSTGGGGRQSKQATARAFAEPGGEWIVWVVALGIIAFGVYQVYRAATAKLSNELDVDGIADDIGSWAIVVSRFGIAARGVVFAAISMLLVRAATHHDPEQAGGMANALNALRMLGRWPSAAIALGLVAYGGYELLNARYRRIRVA